MRLLPVLALILAASCSSESPAPVDAQVAPDLCVCVDGSIPPDAPPVDRPAVPDVLDAGAADAPDGQVAPDVVDASACDACPAVPGATATCDEGVCGFACQPHRADCDRNAENGCEVDVALDTNNCGACGAACGAGGVCIAGACRCPSGQTLCGAGSTAICASLDSDTANCGACGRACPPASGNSVATCVNGTCGAGPIVCPAGRASCDGNAANGCETDTNDSLVHCGACGRACLPPNASGICASGACGIGGCNVGFADCDGNAANGCETDVRTTPQHCGACGRACALPNAVAGCIAAACVVAECNSGFADCNRNPANGCETDVRTVQNCGRCGSSCPTGEVCRMGAAREWVCQRP